jgi:hypothetical protein
MVVNYWLPDDIKAPVRSFRPGDVNADTMHFDFISDGTLKPYQKISEMRQEEFCR